MWAQCIKAGQETPRIHRVQSVWKCRKFVHNPYEVERFAAHSPVIHPTGSFDHLKNNAIAMLVALNST